MPPFTATTPKSGVEILSLLEDHPCCYGWLWGLPQGWSDQHPSFRRFIEETNGLLLIESTMVIRIHQLDEKKAKKFIGFLRWPLNLFVTCWSGLHFEGTTKCFHYLDACSYQEAD